MLIAELTKAVSAVCPIDGIADNGDGTYRIDFKPEITPEQQQAAWDALNNYQPQPAAKWDDFRKLFPFDAGYQRIASNSSNITLNTLLVPLLWQVGANPVLLPSAAQIWNMMVANVPPTPEEASDFQGIAELCDMPFSFNTTTGAIQVAD